MIMRIVKYQPIEHEEQRVLTTEQLASIYETEINNIQVNFKNHKDNFVEGKHYYLLQGEQLKEFKDQLNDIQIVGKRASSLYLWTERGANRHCKILDTDKAWDQFDNLEETYFRVKEGQASVSELSPELQMFKQMFDAVAKQQLEQKQMKEQLNQVNNNALQANNAAEEAKKELQGIRETIIVDHKEKWRTETNSTIGRICKARNDYKTPKDEIYKALEGRAKCNLKQRLENLKGRALKSGMSRSQADKLNYLDVISQDVRLKEIYITIVTQMAIKHKV